MENAKLRAEMKERLDKAEIWLNELKAEKAAALLQIEGLKKDKEKITEGALRFVHSSLCEGHQGRVKMQSPGEFIAEHDGKCVLCAFRLLRELQERYDIYAEHLKTCVVYIAPEIPCDCGFLEADLKRVCATCGAEHTGPCLPGGIS